MGPEASWHITKSHLDRRRRHACSMSASTGPGSPPNEIVASALGLMAYVDDVRRSGGDVVAGVERRGRPKTVLTIDPCRQYEYVGEELRYGVLDLNLGGEAEMQLGRLCAYVGPDGISRSRSIDDVVRDAIWTARWVADVFSHNQRARESQRLPVVGPAAGQSGPSGPRSMGVALAGRRLACSKDGRGSRASGGLAHHCRY
jgi:hypothetical protein